MSSVAHLVKEILANLGARDTKNYHLLSNNSWTKRATVQSSQRMQIVALAILLKKYSQEFFAQVHSFWDKWEKQHDDRKHGQN